MKKGDVKMLRKRKYVLNAVWIVLLLLILIGIVITPLLADFWEKLSQIFPPFKWFLDCTDSFWVETWLSIVSIVTSIILAQAALKITEFDFKSSILLNPKSDGFEITCVNPENIEEYNDIVKNLTLSDEFKHETDKTIFKIRLRVASDIKPLMEYIISNIRVNDFIITQKDIIETKTNYVDGDNSFDIYFKASPSDVKLIPLCYPEEYFYDTFRRVYMEVSFNIKSEVFKYQKANLILNLELVKDEQAKKYTVGSVTSKLK